MELLLGVVFGYVIAKLIFLYRNHPAGTLKIDHSNPEKDVYRFEIDDFESLSKKHKIVLKIDNNADLSQ